MNETAIERDQLLRIADAVPAVVALYDIGSGEYLYVNQALTRLLGYQTEEFIEGGMTFVASLVHPDDLKGMMLKNQQAIKTANSAMVDTVESFEYRLRHKEGHWCWVHTEGTVFERDSDGNVSQLLNVSLDITDRKKAELQLMRSMKTLEAVLADH